MQGEMRLGAGDSIAYMNQKSRHRIACAVAEAGWNESIKSVSEAVQWASYCEQHGLLDCYASDNTFRSWRNVTNVKEITRLAVDLDYYRTVYRELDPLELWLTIKSAMVWMPEPTIIESSGRGAYLKWKLSRALPINNHTKKFNFLGQWQVCQDFLTECLKPYGADPKSSDVTRVLRVSGTVNSRSLTRAQAWTCGPEYEFSAIKEILNEQHRRLRPNKPKPPQKTVRPSASVERMFNWHSLAFARLRDLEKLATLRGGRFKDHRRRAIFVYAVELANYCRSEESLLRELRRFVAQHILDPTAYEIGGKKIHVKEILRRFAMQEKRGHWEWFIDDSTGRHNKQNRYTLRTATIIDDLCISEAEQAHMSALIGEKEKYRRKVAKRKVQSEKSKAVKKESHEHKVKLIAKLKSQGLSQRAIADRFGVTARTLSNWAK